MDRGRDLVIANEAVIHGLADALVERRVLHGAALVKAIEDAERSLSGSDWIVFSGPNAPSGHEGERRPRRA